MTVTIIKQGGETKRPKQGRSPAYPGIALDKALEKAKALYDAEGKYAAPMPSAFKAWGFGEKSSGGRETRAALRYFGLIGIEGDGETGKVKLTDDALRILLDEREDQSEKKMIIRRIALNPAIHKKLFEKFPDGIKSDATVEHYLVFEEGYNKSAAGELVAEFKETATFAELYEPASMLDKSLGDKDGPKSENAPKPGVSVWQKGQQVQLMQSERELKKGLLGKDASFRLIVSGQIGVKEIERLIKQLELDKEILGENSDGDEQSSQ